MHEVQSSFPVWMLCSITIMLCITVHELGHAAAARVTGERVNHFVLLSLRPHVRVAGPSTPEQTAFKAAAGSGLLLAGWLAFVALFPRARKYWPAVAVSFLVVLIGALAWVLSSVSYPYGPRGDDVGKFIRYSGVHPAAVSAWCLMTAGACPFLPLEAGKGIQFTCELKEILPQFLFEMARLRRLSSIAVWRVTSACPMHTLAVENHSTPPATGRI
jgi:hypothetical protein